MKKQMLFGALLLVLTLGGGLLIAGEPIHIVIDGQEVITDTAPQMVNNRVMVPLRVISEKLGAKVNWNAEKNTVEIQSKQVSSLKLMKINGEPTTWPYWYKDKRVYVECRNAVQIIREARPSLTVNFFPNSDTLVFSGRHVVVPTFQEGNFKTMSLDYLQSQDIINFDFDPDQGNLTIK